MSSVLERIENLESVVGNPDPMTQMIANKLLGLERAVAQMGKTLAAVSDELTETGIMDGVSVMARLRQQEDENAKTHVKMLLDQGVIRHSDKVNGKSLVVINQNIVNTTTGSVMTVSGYNLIGMNSSSSNMAWKDALMGKSKGDTINGLSDDTEQEVVSVIEIYEITETPTEKEESADYDNTPTGESDVPEEQDVFNETGE